MPVAGLRAGLMAVSLLRNESLFVVGGDDLATGPAEQGRHQIHRESIEDEAHRAIAEQDVAPAGVKEKTSLSLLQPLPQV